jgi:hypothetical protein
MINMSAGYLSIYQVIVMYIYIHVKDERNATAVMFFQVEKNDRTE